MDKQPPIPYQGFQLCGKTVLERACFVPPFVSKVNFDKESCFIFSVSGRTRIFSIDEQFELFPGQGALVRCGTFIHKWRTVKAADDRFIVIAVHFNQEVLADVYQGQLPGFLKPSSMESQHSLAPVKGDAALLKYMDGLLFYFDNPELVDEDLIRLKLKEMLLLLYKAEDPEVRALLGRMFHPRDVRFRETIETHLYHELSPSELAQLCGMSLANFKRHFTQVFGDSPMRYIRSRRLIRARELIAGTKQPIGDICFQVGFQDLSHFNKSFKEQFGQPPSAFRTH